MFSFIITFLILLLVAISFTYSWIFGIILSLISLFLLVVVFKKKTASKNVVIISIVIGSGIASYMMALLPGNQHVPEQTTVRISVQGKHSNTSKGNEVWLTEWQLDGENQSLGTVIENKPGWRMIYDRAFAATANDLIWTGKVKNKIELKFLKHPWSGLVKVSINEFNEEIDLYSEQDSEYIISLPIKGGGTITNVAQWCALFICAFIFVACWLVYSRPVRSQVWATSFIPFLFWMLFALAFYPGLMSADSLFQWQQAHTHQYADHQPIIHTFFIYLATRLYDSPFVIVFIQIVILSILIGYISVRLLELKVHKVFVLTFILISTFLPINGIFSVTLWKDVLYGDAILALTVWLLNFYYTNGKVLEEKKGWLIAGSLIFLMLSLRHNGLAPAVIFSLIIVFAFKAYRKNSFKAISFGLALTVMANVLIHLCFPVTPSPKWLPLAIPIHNISSIVHSGVILEQKDIDVLNKSMPIDQWKTSYTPYSTDSLFYNPNMNRAILGGSRSDIINIWIKEAVRHPVTVIKDWAALTSLLWQVKQPTDGYLYATHSGIDQNELGLKAKPIIGSEIKSNISSFIVKSQNGGSWSSFLWRPAGFLYITLFSTLVIYFFVNRKYVFIIMPLLADIFSLFATLPAQDARYAYSIYLCAPLMLFLAGSVIYNRYLTKSNKGLLVGKRSELFG